jgi:hypothetical protein
VNYQIYNFQPSDFKLVNNPEDPVVANYTSDLMLEYWNYSFKVNFLRYLNRETNPSFNLPSSSFAWIDPLI